MTGNQQTSSMININVDDFFSEGNHKLIIRNILATYHQRWDAIGEVVQNAVDSVLKRMDENEDEYQPQITITYDNRTQVITIEDNGLGISDGQISKIPSPHFTTKDPNSPNRGEFGVGLSFVAFCSNDFKLESLFSNEKSKIEIINGYSWAMDTGNDQNLEIKKFSPISVEGELSYTKISFKPIRFYQYSFKQLEFLLRRYTAIGDFWSCYNDEDGPITVSVIVIDSNGNRTQNTIENKFWHPVDYFGELGRQVIEYDHVENVIEHRREAPIPNWIGSGLKSKGIITYKNIEYPYYALFCRANYYKLLSVRLGIEFSEIPLEHQIDSESQSDLNPEDLQSGIIICKKGMPIGASVDRPRTYGATYFSGMFIVINSDRIQTEPGRKRLHVSDEKNMQEVAKQIFKKLVKYWHYFISVDLDEESESILTKVTENYELVKIQKRDHCISKLLSKINLTIEPLTEQTVIALFHELIGARILQGYKALKLSTIDTYDGIYEYEVRGDDLGSDAWMAHLRSLRADKRRDIQSTGLLNYGPMVIEFKLHLHSIIDDFTNRKKYHRDIKLIVVWDVNRDMITNREWALEPIDLPKQKFHGARWRLRPNSQGQTMGIVATDVLILKEFIESLEN